MPLYFNYTLANAAAFNFSAFSCIAFVVFLSSTQPFYLSEVLGFKHKDNIGHVIGILGFIDELTSIISAPLIGALSDEISAKKACGSKITVSVGFLLIGISLICYGKFATQVFPDLILYRSLFAVGVIACMSMVTVMFTEISNSDFDLLTTLRRFRYGIRENESIRVFSGTSANIDPETLHLLGEPSSGGNDDDGSKSTGKYAAMIGISTGLGAIFSVSFFLTMPAKLQDYFTSLTMSDTIKLSYVILGLLSIVIGVILYFFLYSKEIPSSPPSVSTNYFQLLLHGLHVSQHDPRIQLSYVGSLVARSTTVLTSIFIPLLVYNFYSKTGKCSSSSSSSNHSKETCYDGYIFAAILTGVSQTIALCASPFWGLLIDNERVGKYRSLFLSGLFGFLGCFGICVHSLNVDELYDPRNWICFVMVSSIGISQIGIIMSSMSLLSSVVKDTRDSVSIGSISGVYSLFGGVGILLLTIIGGSWSDKWILGPFFLLGLFNLILIIGSGAFWKPQSN
ncbi:hypothetical protein CLIB1423_02S06810 [[Candida] railenensis]|uniref:Major facilitator superfamily (MFS) profile domain-containing protein n=1 Tax=[Candida] railenensis TaxID=45579 RepID=A0A9P0QLQ9_9ASCO|nr:hypothetical protein CLIB1423_02S06810 [[Candida] railenensis]